MVVTTRQSSSAHQPCYGGARPGGREKDEKQFLPDLQTIRLGLTVFGHYINSFNRQTDKIRSQVRDISSPAWRCQNYSLEIWPKHKHEKQKSY